MNKKKFIILGALILILLTGWAYLSLYKNSVDNTPNTNEVINNEEENDLSSEALAEVDTSDWEVYRNEELGFEFKYPRNLDIKDDGEKIYVIANLPWPQRGTSLIISKVEHILEEFIDSYNKADILPDGTALATIFEVEDYYIDGVQAYLLKGSTSIGIDSNKIFVTNNNRKYVISFMDHATDEELKIIKSFKFIK